MAVDRDRKRRATQAGMVPVKLAFDVRVTVTVAFASWPRWVAGVTVTPKSTGVPETLIADEVEEPWSVSPL